MATPDVLVDLAGSKLRKKHGSSLQEHLSAPTSAFARKQLEKMGWTEGTGLGKKRDGITTHVKVKKREEKAGLGIEKVASEKRAAGEQWWKDSLGATLAKLGSKQKKKSSKRKREYTDEELFEATGGARFGMRAAPTQKLAKWSRSESGVSSCTEESARENDIGKDESAAQTSSDTEKNREKKKKKKSKKEKKTKKDKCNAKSHGGS